MTCTEALELATLLIPARRTTWRAALALRPGRSVLHAYAGPLTPSGRFIPRSRRTVCGTPTGRLTVHRVAGGLDNRSSARTVLARLCRRCSARLAPRSPRGGPAGHIPPPGSREHYLATYAGLTAWHLAVDAWLAETVAEVEHVEWLALLLVGIPGVTRDRITAPSGKVLPPINTHLLRARARLRAPREDPHALDPGLKRFLGDVDASYAAERARRRAEREERIRSVAGFGYSPATQHLRPAEDG